MPRTLIRCYTVRMSRTRIPSPETQAKISNAIETLGLRGAAKALRMHASTVRKVSRGQPVFDSTLGAIHAWSGPKAPGIEAFEPVPPERRAPRRSQIAAQWDSVAAIQSARAQQQIGVFELPYLLARTIRTDSAIFPPRNNRLAAISAVSAGWQPAPGVRGEFIAKQAKQHITISRATIKALAGTLLDHGVAFAYITHETEPDGRWVNFRVREWCIRHVKWDDTIEQYVTNVRDGLEREIIRHGDGRWIVISKSDSEPWAEESTLLAAAIVYASHATVIRNWNRSTDTHGSSKVIGTLGDGRTTHQSDGTLTKEADALITMLNDIVSNPDIFAGILPHGATVDSIFDGSTNYQVFSELEAAGSKLAARIYCGNDGTLGSQGGAPGVDISALFGVTSTLLQGDAEAISRAFHSGLSVPWTALNFGDSRHAATWEFELPDPDAEKRQAQRAGAEGRLMTAIEARKKNGLEVNQTVVDELAAKLGVSPAPTLALAGKQTNVVLAPTDIAKVVTVDEARDSQGLGPHPDPTKGKLFVSELESLAKANPTTTLPAPGTAPEPPVPDAPIG